MSGYWPRAKGEKWRHGRVKDIDEHGHSTVAYDDEEREVLYLAEECFKLEEVTPSPGSYLPSHCYTQHRVSMQRQSILHTFSHVYFCSAHSHFR